MKLRTDCSIRKNSCLTHVFTENNSVYLNDLTDVQIEKLIYSSKNEINLESYISQDDLQKLFAENLLIIDENLLFKDELEKSQYKWFSYLGKKEKTWKEFRELKIGVLGCGGIGALASQTLAASGINNFVLIDDDKINKDNLNRQFTYRRDDIGKLKTHVLSELLTRNYSEVIIEKYDECIINSSRLVEVCSSVDILLCCADKPVESIHKICSEFSYLTGIPVIFGSVGFMNGTIGPLINNAISAFNYKKACEIIGPKQINSLCEVNFASNGATNSIIANMIAMEVIFFFSSIEKCSTINTCMNMNFISLETKKMFKIK